MPKLTVKQRKFIANKAKGMSGAEAARQAGYSPRSATEIASENLSKPNVRDAFLKAMEKQGITDDKLVKVLNEGLEANRTISAIPGTEANGGTVDFVDVPDHATRHKFLKTAADIKGLEAAKKVEAYVTTPEDFLATLDDDTGGEDAESAESGQEA